MIATPPYIPQQSDIVWVTLDPTLGHEQGGRRPALVLSAKAYGTRSRMAIVCPITSRRKNYPYEVVLPQGMLTSGVVLADQVRSIDLQQRRVEFAEAAPRDTLLEVFDKLQSLLPDLCQDENAS